MYISCILLLWYTFYAFSKSEWHLRKESNLMKNTWGGVLFLVTVAGHWSTIVVEIALLHTRSTHILCENILLSKISEKHLKSSIIASKVADVKLTTSINSFSLQVYFLHFAVICVLWTVKKSVDQSEA